MLALVLLQVLLFIPGLSRESGWVEAVSLLAVGAGLPVAFLATRYFRTSTTILLDERGLTVVRQPQLLPWTQGRRWRSWGWESQSHWRRGQLGRCRCQKIVSKHSTSYELRILLHGGGELTLLTVTKPAEGDWLVSTFNQALAAFPPPEPTLQDPPGKRIQVTSGEDGIELACSPPGWSWAMLVPCLVACGLVGFAVVLGFYFFSQSSRFQDVPSWHLLAGVSVPGGPGLLILGLVFHRLRERARFTIRGKSLTLRTRGGFSLSEKQRAWRWHQLHEAKLVPAKTNLTGRSPILTNIPFLQLVPKQGRAVRVLMFYEPVEILWVVQFLQHQVQGSLG